MIPAQCETETERSVRIAEIRRQIAAGTYETPEKLSAAVDALVAQIDARRSSETLENRPKNKPR